MNDTDIRRILKDDKTWLAAQPGMQPWDDACVRLATLLSDCLRRYSEQVRDRAAAEADADRPLYLARLWRCLGYHWRDAAEASPDGLVEAEQVARRIAGGQGYRRGGQLGGDPLRDVVLAVAMVRKDQRAPRVFQDDYFPFACGLAAKVHRRLAAEPDPWWNELLDHLAGYTRPTAKLDKFCGHSALRNWLGTVVWTFLRRWRFSDGEGRELDDPPDRPSPPAESLDHFAEIVRLAIAELSSNDRLMLALIYVDGLNQKRAAGVLGVDPGTVTRRLEKALPRLQTAIRQIAAGRLSAEACAGVFEDLRDNPSVFATRLREALEEGRDRTSAFPG